MKKAKKRKYNLGGLQQFQQPQQQSLVDSQSEQQANALVSGVGAINPIVGAAMKVGQGVGAQTMNNNGLYNSRAGAFLDNNINPTTGITNFKDLSGDFTASTVANQLSAGLFGRSATQTRRKKELAMKQLKDKASTNLDLITNSGQAGFAKGGNLTSKKLKVIEGGSLNPISPDAVEVNATNPSEVDSVELSNAFVDNNEIIDNKDRVFSDIVTAPTGRTVAQEAKKLEKMKSTNARFADSNQRLDGKLNDLFNYQEAVKAAEVKTKFTGNKDNRIFDDDAFVNMIEGANKSEQLRNMFSDDPKKRIIGKYSNTDFSKSSFAKGGYVKAKPVYEKGGPFSHSTSYDDTIREDPFAGMTEPMPGNTFNWGQAANTAATFAPNIVNAFLQRKLKGPAAPRLENNLKLDRVDPSAQLADAARQANMANNLITRNTAQGANLASSVGSILAKRLAANNQIYGQNQALNANIQGTEAQLNQNVQARNIERSNAFKNNQVDFQNAKLRMTSENVANLSGKLQSQQRERNLMNLDRDKFNIIQSRFEDLPEEMRAKYPSVFDYYNSSRKTSNALGGKLKKPYTKGGKMRC